YVCVIIRTVDFASRKTAQTTFFQYDRLTRTLLTEFVVSAIEKGGAFSNRQSKKQQDTFPNTRYIGIQTRMKATFFLAVPVLMTVLNVGFAVFLSHRHDRNLHRALMAHPANQETTENEQQHQRQTRLHHGDSHSQ
ncbi:MAG: hypothetical protein ACK5Q1_04325, partial [Limnobacter sp.]